MARTEKIRSDTGASFALALLLFLVCTVAGTVVLTAATAAAGRLSELSEMDQRYYSVASAARLLAQELSGSSDKLVTIKRTRVFTSTTMYPFDGTRPPVTSSSDVYTTEVRTGGNEPPFSEDKIPDRVLNSSLLTRAAVYYLYGKGTGEDNPSCNGPTDFAYSIYSSPYTANTENIGGFTFTHSSDRLTNSDIQSLAVDCSCRLENNGHLYVTVKNRSSDFYSLTITLQAVPYESSDQSYDWTPPYESSDSVIETSTNTETKTSTLYWIVKSIGWKEAET